MDGLRNNAVITQELRVRGRPFAAGNPGRRPGSRNKASLAVEALLEGEAEALTRVAIEKAKQGDTTALRLCLERLLPPRKDRPVSFQLPPLTSARDAVQASAALLQAVAEGELTPLEAAELSKLVANFVEALKACELEARLEALEARTNL
jgi:hypothetical protein